jgi:beta-phosphoglucomutase-like phosphatase (HAD superfamily)
MGFDDVANFDFIDKPDPEVFLRALEDLLAMYCLPFSLSRSFWH